MIEHKLNNYVSRAGTFDLTRSLLPLGGGRGGGGGGELELIFFRDLPTDL